MVETDQQDQRQQDELAARRAKQEEGDMEAGKSIEEMEESGELAIADEGDGQFAFEVPVGPKGKELTWKDLVPRGIPVEHRVAMSGKSIPNPRGGLLDPNDLNGLLLVSYVLDHYKPQYIRDEDGKVSKVIVYAVIKPKHVVNARSEAGDTLLNGEAAA
jgi:hypothetical protein